MRKKAVLVLVPLVAGGLVLSACDVGASFNSTVSSLGSSPYLQGVVTATMTGPDVTTSDATLLKNLSIVEDFASTNGTDLSQAQGDVNAQFDVNYANTSLAELRVVNGNVYVLVDPTAFAHVPGVNLSTSEATELNLLFQGRWFEFPKALLSSFAPSAQEKAAAAKDATAERTIADAVVAAVEKGSYTTLPGGGYSQTGELQTLVDAALPGVDALVGTTENVKVPNDKYTLTLSLAGTTVTGGSISVTGPEAGSTATITVATKITHDTVVVNAPASPLIVSKSLIQQLIQQLTPATS